MRSAIAIASIMPMVQRFDMMVDAIVIMTKTNIIIIIIRQLIS